MGGIYVIGEVTADGHLANISAEVATLARNVAAEGGQQVSGIVVAADPQQAAEELARYLPRVLTVTESAAADRPWSMVAAERIARILRDDVREFEFVGAGPDGRDFAGALSALMGWGVLGNAVAVTWADDSPLVEMSVFGGKLTTTSRFTTDAGIVTVRPNVVTAQPADTAGTVEPYESDEALEQPPVKVVERISEASAAVPIEEAKIIVAGGRGVGGAEGFALVEELAAAIGGVVGATRAAVDSGWIPYSQQIGQTGKIVKPQLYFALGHQRRHPAQGRDADGGHDRGRQSRPRRAHCRIRRHGRRRRPVRRRPGSPRRAPLAVGLRPSPGRGAPAATAAPGLPRAGGPVADRPPARRSAHRERPARSRASERAVRDLDERIGMSLDGAAQRIDSVRRQQLSAEGAGRHDQRDR